MPEIPPKKPDIKAINSLNILKYLDSKLKEKLILGKMLKIIIKQAIEYIIKSIGKR